MSNSLGGNGRLYMNGKPLVEPKRIKANPQKRKPAPMPQAKAKPGPVFTDDPKAKITRHKDGRVTAKAPDGRSTTWTKKGNGRWYADIRQQA